MAGRIYDVGEALLLLARLRSDDVTDFCDALTNSRDWPVKVVSSPMTSRKGLTLRVVASAASSSSPKSVTQV